MNESFKVYVSCMTYNQSAYIKDAMDGFCMQQTNFPYVCGIVDDASTDGAQEVIHHYLENHFDLLNSNVVKRDETDDYIRCFAQHKTNKNCFFVVVYLKYNHYRKKTKAQYVEEWEHKAKYLALCEGDDYWIDANKLQKQVDFLETHPEYGLVYTNCYVSINDRLRRKATSGYCDFHHLLINDEIATLTTCFRSNMYYSYIDRIKPQSKDWLMGDLPLWLYLSYYSKVCFFNDYTSIYRRLPESASHSENIDKTIGFIDDATEIRRYMLESLAGVGLDFEKRTNLITKTGNLKKMAVYSSIGDREWVFVLYKESFVFLNLKDHIKCWYYLIKAVLHHK